MNAKQIERASYLAAHAILSANVSAPHLATPGARRSYVIDAIANKIRDIFELQCSAIVESKDASLPADPVEGHAHGSHRGAASVPPSKLQLVLQKMR